MSAFWSMGASFGFGCIITRWRVEVYGLFCVGAGFERGAGGFVVGEYFGGGKLFHAAVPFWARGLAEIDGLAVVVFQIPFFQRSVEVDRVSCGGCGRGHVVSFLPVCPIGQAFLLSGVGKLFFQALDLVLPGRGHGAVGETVKRFIKLVKAGDDGVFTGDVPFHFVLLLPS